MSNMYGKDKFHDRQKAVLQKSAQKIENDSGWSQDNFLREYTEEILPASRAELSFDELCVIGEQVEQEAAFSAKEAMRNKIKARRDVERYKATSTDSGKRTPNPFEDSNAVAIESPKNEDTLNTTRKHADAPPTKSAVIKTSKKQSLVETARELKKYIHIISCGGVLYYHNEYYYTQLDSKQLIKLYRQNVDYELNNESSLRGYKDLYDCLVTDPQIECSEPEDEPIYAPLENGILDLMEWKLYPHSPDQITFTCIKAKYDPQAKCQIFEEYLQRVTGGDSLLSERVWMAIGYLLIYPARGKFFIFMKGIGNSGKSVLGSFIRRLYPKESISSIRLKQMKAVVMSANVETMFSVRETPWHGLGRIVMDAPASREALELAGLDWQVESRNIYSGTGAMIPGYRANVRSTDEAVLGVVSDRYRIVQNEEAFQFTDDLLGEGVTYETAGSLQGGKKVWMLAKLPEKYIIAGDEVTPYLVFFNSHDGSSGVKVAMTPIRVVCQNTLNLALGTAKRI